MFDVSWTDHNVVTVGQRKSRKEKSGTSTKSSNLNDLSRRFSMLSSSSSEGQTKPTLLNFFGNSSAAPGQKSLQRSKSHSKLGSSPDQRITEASRWVHNHCDASALEPTAHELSGIIPPPTLHSPSSNSVPLRPYTGHASDASESALSGWTGMSAETQSSWSSVAESTKSPSRIVQPLSPTSYIFQNTEVTVSPRGSFKDLEPTATIVHISASDAPFSRFKDPLPRSPSPREPSSFPFPNCSPPEDKSTPRVKNDKSRTGWPFTTRSGTIKGDKWKAPETWGRVPDNDVKYPDRPTIVIGEHHFEPKQAEGQSSPNALELTQLQRNIRRMEAASPKIVLERLKEEWNEIADASIYRELELEKQLWMLTALRSLKRRASNDQIAPAPSLTGTTKVLSLYENQAAASSMSALTTASEVHHLSTSPLTPECYPNVRPLAVPGPTSQLPYASNNFASINAFCLPSLLPASSIPSILRECHRTLTSTPSPSSPISLNFSSTSPTPRTTRGGSLHLTILDPSPIPSTLGPRLRNWLDNNLVINLEKQFRCTNPARLFPSWLADAGLRAEGSTIVHVRFFASVSPSTFHLARPLSAGGGSSEGGSGLDATKQELKSIVGRMLWKEMWGAYASGDRWWWEDDNIVEECERMGTCWEYAVIEAIKEG